MTKIVLGDGGTSEFFLNFAAGDGPLQPSCTGCVTNAHSDGNDAIFGDLGNDWLVGGTGQDQLFGGWGNDLMNARRRPDAPTAALNTTPDTHPSYEDRAYGGAGRDVLIGNTGGDRLIDWVGEFNRYLVPFAPFGLGTVSRTAAAAAGRVPVRALEEPRRRPDASAPTPTAATASRDGELGLVRQQDFAWQDQTGGPIDPQAGNVPGGSRDVLRSATFNQTHQPRRLRRRQRHLGGLGRRAPGRRHLAPRRRGRRLQHPRLPAGVLRGAGVDQRRSSRSPAGRRTPTSSSTTRIRPHFKFAGIDVSINKLVMGHRDASGWIMDEQTPFQAKPDTFYNLLLAVNGLTATLIVNNAAVFSHTYAAARRRRLHVRPQLRLRRLRLRQLARQLRQHRRAGAAAGDHLRPHRGLRRRRRPAVHGHAGRHVRARTPAPTTASRPAAARRSTRSTSGSAAASRPARTSSSRRSSAQARSAACSSTPTTPTTSSSPRSTWPGSAS